MTDTRANTPQEKHKKHIWVCTPACTPAATSHQPPATSHPKTPTKESLSKGKVRRRLEDILEKHELRALDSLTGGPGSFSEIE